MAKIKVCLDAGHYGKYNRSPAVKSYYESEMVWTLHLMLKEELERYGIEVITTRKDQAKDLSLKSRGMAGEGCDLLLSLHSNAVGNSGVNESVDHASAYCQVSDKGIKIDEVSRELGSKLAAVVADVMDLHDGWKMSTRLSDNDKDGDGVLDDNYYGVLNGARLAGVPGIILEHSFHTNTRSTKWLMVDTNLRKLAVAEAKCIAEYFSVQAPAATTPDPEPSGAVYRVQVGAFTRKVYAEAQLDKVKDAGFTDAFIAQVGAYYKVQVGAYIKKANAEAQLAKVKAAGFDAFVTTQRGQSVPVTPKIKVGSTVRVKKGATNYTGQSLASFVYGRDHKVSQISGNRCVITYDGVVVAAVHINNLTLV